jgi:hypothetical protein
MQREEFFFANGDKPGWVWMVQFWALIQPSLVLDHVAIHRICGGWTDGESHDRGILTSRDNKPNLTETFTDQF